MIMRFSAAGRPRVVQNDRAADMIRLLKTYRRQRSCTVRAALAASVAKLAAELDAFDEFSDPLLPPVRGGIPRFPSAPPANIGGYQPAPADTDAPVVPPPAQL